MKTNSYSFSVRFLAALFLALLSLSSAHAQEKTPEPARPKVRAITAFIILDRGRYQLQISETVQFLKLAKTTFESRDQTVQTLRIATQPFPEYTKGLSREQAIQFFKNLDGLAQQEHIVISVGPAYLSGDDGEAQADLLADILQNSKALYGTVYVTNDSGVNWPAVQAAARVVKKLADSTPHSEGNFHFAALANVPPNAPFFPAAYLTGAGHQFSVGLESAGTVAAAFQNAADLATARRRLIDLLFQQASDVDSLARRVDAERGWSYLGLDLSPAPSKDDSIGAAIESLSKQPFGASGTLTAAATITSALKEIGLRRTGYSGLMLPILEDPILAERWNSGSVSVDALLSYSAVCGTGLDTIPLSGDTSLDALARIIGDVASLSVKWNKPLSARLLPVAGKRAGDQTEFTDPNLLNAVIQPLGPH
jgi:uncharacterized protein (UPF0210 family)